MRSLLTPLTRWLDRRIDARIAARDAAIFHDLTHLKSELQQMREAQRSHSQLMRQISSQGGGSNDEQS